MRSAAPVFALLVALLALAHPEVVRPEGRRVATLRICGRDVAVTSRSLSLAGYQCDVADFARATKLTELRSLQISGDEVQDRHIRALRGLGKLEVLEIGHTSITNSALRQVGTFHGLKALDLGYSEGLSGAGLAHLAPLKRLEHLVLPGTALTDIGLRHLARLESLRRVESTYSHPDDEHSNRPCRGRDRCFDIRSPSVSPSGVAHLEALRVEHLHLLDGQVTDRILAQVPRMASLVSLNCDEESLPSKGRLGACVFVASAEGVSISGLRSLKRTKVARLFFPPEVVGGRELAVITSIPALGAFNCRQDECTDLEGTRVEAGHLRHLRRLGRVRFVSLPAGIELTPPVAKGLFALPGLEAVDSRTAGVFDLRGTKIGDGALAEIVAAKSVREVSLKGSSITDASADHLARLRKLERVDVVGTGMTAAGIGKLLAISGLESLEVPPGLITEGHLAAVKTHPSLRFLNVEAELCEEMCRFGFNCVGAGDCEDHHYERCDRLCEGSDGSLVVRLGPASRGRGTKLFDMALTQLAGSKRKLRVYADRIDDAALAKLVALPNLEAVGCLLPNCYDLGGSGVSAKGLGQVRRLAKVERLVLPGGVKVDDSVLGLLGSLPDLHTNSEDWRVEGRLEIEGSPGRVTLKGLGRLKGLRRVRSLHVPAELLTDRSLALFATFPHLESISCFQERCIDLAESKVTRSGLGALKRLRKARVVYVDPDMLTDGTLALLVGLPEIVSINCGLEGGSPPIEDDCVDLTGSKVSKRGLAALKRLKRARRFVIPSELLDDSTIATIAAIPRIDALNCFDVVLHPERDVSWEKLRPSCFRLAETAVTAKGLAGLRRLRLKELEPPEGVSSAEAKRLLPTVEIVAR